MARTSRSAYVDKMELGTFWYAEDVVGAVDGSNTTFTISVAPNPQSSLDLVLNGQILKPTTDFTISDNTITTLQAYPSGSVSSFMAHFRVEP